MLGSGGRGNEAEKLMREAQEISDRFRIDSSKTVKAQIENDSEVRADPQR